MATCINRPRSPLPRYSVLEQVRLISLTCGREAWDSATASSLLWGFYSSYRRCHWETESAQYREVAMIIEYLL